MDEDTDRGSEATQLEQNSSPEDTNNLHDDGEDSAAATEDDEQRDVTPFQISPISPVEESQSTTCQSVTLEVSDLSEVPVKYEMRRDELEHLKNQLQGSHQEALATVIAKAAAQAHSDSQILSLQCSTSQGAEADHTDYNNTTDPKSLSVKIPPIDGYNWRKYGQKQVKSPEGSRSYYKCTYTECDAKKIESCDQFNSVTKIVYKGQHEHDPPKKIISKGGKILSTPKSLKRKTISTPIQVEQQINDPQQKQRVKKSSSLISHSSVPKHPKKPKFIVHAAVDVETSADGYRWRKYGQKMVKGNPHPRNYYKCTSAGCPVRKHIEKAVDGTSEVIITYKGAHDHDMPVPKKRQPPPTGVLITPASSASKRSETLLTHGSTTEAVKTNESAPTLLSVGFEIKRR